MAQAHRPRRIPVARLITVLMKRYSCTSRTIRISRVECPFSRPRIARNFAGKTVASPSTKIMMRKTRKVLVTKARARPTVPPTRSITAEGFRSSVGM